MISFLFEQVIDFILYNGPELHGWKIARNVRGERGFVPGNYLHVVQDAGVGKASEPKPAMSPATEYKNLTSEKSSKQAATAKTTAQTGHGSTGLQQSGGTSKDPRMGSSTGGASTPPLTGQPGKFSKKDKPPKDKPKKEKNKDGKEKTKTKKFTPGSKK